MKFKTLHGTSTDFIWLYLPSATVRFWFRPVWAWKYFHWGITDDGLKTPYLTIVWEQGNDDQFVDC